MNLRFLDKLSKVLSNLNKSLADELNQPTSFPTVCSNKKYENPIKPQKPSGLGF